MTLASIGAALTGLAVGLTFHWSVGVLMTPVFFGLYAVVAWAARR